MLRDPLLQERFTRHLERTLSLARNELDRTHEDAEMNEVVRLYHNRLTRAQQSWENRWKRDLVSAFAELQRRGVIEIITCGATHGFLPLMEQFPEAVPGPAGDRAERLPFHLRLRSARDLAARVRLFCGTRRSPARG
jgi:1,4-alpha-glucan branching enzyme